tara:strand:- start:3125 stop:3508 length:384 start_codon:yes stop_codon:yes gene_type:complete
MGVRENKVEKYLDKEVQKLGGITRKWVSPGRDGVPDRIVIIKGKVFFVEVKTTDGKLSDVQCRECNRLDKAGADVTVVYGDDGVDWFIARVRSKECYQCEEAVPYLFDDSRCINCTRLTPEEIRGDL